MSHALHGLILRNDMKTPLFCLLLISLVGSAVGAPTSLDATQPDTSTGSSGSRANRPVVNAPALGHTTLGMALVEKAAPLNAEQLAAIQNVGRSVLAAKHSVQPDPVVETMRQQLNAVSSELVRVSHAGLMSKPILHKNNLSNLPVDASATAKTEIPPPSRRLVPGLNPRTFVEETVMAPPEAAAIPSAAIAEGVSTPAAEKNTVAWHSEVASLQRRLVNARAFVPEISGNSDTKDKLHHHLAEKETRLLDEIQHAVDAQDATQLAALRDRLTSRRLPAEQERLRAQADPDHKIPPLAPTPTVSTLTQHR